jgi:nitrous oxide reductase accessory protein NosL
MLKLTKLLVVIFLLSLLGVNALATDVKMPDENDRCPVCGMFVAPYPDWIATIVFDDGHQLYFDGCKDLFRYYFNHTNHQGGDKLEGVKGIYVSDYYSTRLVPVEDALFVVGSDVYGPMGHELIPVVGRDLAETFKLDHAGTAIYRFDEISPDKLPVD